MQFIRTKLTAVLAMLVGVATLSMPATTAAQFSEYSPITELPPDCERIEVPDGNKVSLRVYATGVQIYRWNGTSWEFVGPVANLYADTNYHGKMGTHYATPDGPAWESNSGSRVIAKRLDGCDPDPSAISWLLLQKYTSEGPGIFNKVSFIQRVNTAGGLRPTLPGLPNEERRVPYTTDYIFYRAAN